MKIKQEEYDKAKRSGSSSESVSPFDRAVNGTLSGKEFNEMVRDFANKTNSNRERELPRDHSSFRKD